MRGKTLLSFAFAILILVSGCSSIPFVGASISEPRVTVVEDTGAVIVFNYSVNDYATVLLEGPSGQVINEARLEPDKNMDGIYMGEPQPGTYKLVVRQGGDTVAEDSVTFEGADPTIMEVEANWAKNNLQSVNVTIRNDGDLPLRVENATYNVRGKSVTTGPLFQWVDSDESKVITLSPMFGAIEITRPGEVRGEVRIETSNRRLTGSFQKTFEGAKLEIDSVRQEWDGGSLQRIGVKVRNTGDLPTSAAVILRHAGEDLGSSFEKRIAAGERVRFDLSSTLGLFTADSGGTVELDIIVDTESGFVSESITHHIEPASLSVRSVSANWDNAELTRVDFKVQNTGEVDGEFTVSLRVNGDTIREGQNIVSAQSRESFYFEGSSFTPLFTATGGGEFTVTISISGPNDQSSKSTTKEFESVSGSISQVDATFLDNYESDTADLLSVSFQVQNTGEVQLTYDSIKISLADASRTERLAFEKSLAPGETSSEIISLLDEIQVEEGRHEMSIELVDDGETVFSTTVTVSTS